MKMSKLFKTTALALGLATVVSLGTVQPVEAGGKNAAAIVGAGALGFALGLGAGGYYGPTQQTYVGPPPVYYQPACRWENRKICSGYRYGYRGGCYWERVQVCG
jgi:hypothetical protein